VTTEDLRLALAEAVSTVTVGDVQLSPDGRRVVYACGPGTAERAEPPTSSLWLVDCGGGPARRLTDSGAADVLPRWSPDGTRIAFLSDRRKRGTAGVYVLDLDRGGEASRLSDGGSAFSLAWSPDGARIAYAAVPDPESSGDDEEAPDPLVVDADVRLTALWLVAPGEQPSDLAPPRSRRLSPEGLHIVGTSFPGTPFDWSPDGRFVVATTARSPKLHDEALAELIVIGLDGTIQSLATCETYGAVPRFSPDGSTIAFNASEGTIPALYTLQIIEATGGEPRALLPGREASFLNLTWLPDGRRLLALAQERQEQRLVIVDVETGRTNEAIEAFARPGVIGARGGFSLSRDGDRVAFTRSDDSSYDDVYGADLGSEALRLTDLNPTTAGRDFGEVRELSWTSFDGTEIDGLLRLPAGYVEGERYPLLLLIHGGPAGAWQHTLYAPPASGGWAAVMAQRGYAVLSPNPRGSSGRGTAFLSEIVGCYGGPDWQDLIAGVDVAIDLGVADPEQLVVGGWSGGGYLTNWTIARTDRFKAAVSGAGISNWVSFQGTSDCRSTFDRYFGRTDERPDIHWQYSPIREIENAKTPTLILFGEKDARVPPSQGYELYEGLEARGVETQLVVYPREGHGILERGHQLDILERVVDWFDSHLGRAGVSDSARSQPAISRGQQPM
jgi:dipeptidyl aminopeptidase/acylaminoacyl peptidase